MERLGTAATAPQPAPTEGLLDQYRGDSDFEYLQHQQPPDNWWVRAKLWLMMKLQQFLFSDSMLQWRYLIFGLIVIAAVVLVVRYLLGSNFRNVLMGRSQQQSMRYGLEEQDVEAMDLDQLIREALQEQRYRQAVRYGYLRLLQTLSRNGLIRWHPSKTNHDYLLELQMKSAATPFATATRQFERIWYGNSSISAAEYQAIAAEFRELDKKMKR